MVEQCSICNTKNPNQTQATLQPIQFNKALERVQIDLIDMCHQPDGNYKWICHIKDHFSKYSALMGQTSKHAEECADSVFPPFLSIILPIIILGLTLLVSYVH